MTNTEFLSAAVIAAREAVAQGAPIHPQGAAAHAANESTYGRSGLATQAHNLFGLKATGMHTPFWTGDYVEMPTWEVNEHGARYDTVARFRRYPSWAMSFMDYGDVIRRVYPNAAPHTDAGFLAGLFLTGPRKWATDPVAFDKAARIIGFNHAVLYPQGEGQWGEARTVVLHGLRLAERWVALTKDPAVIRGRFVWRVRDDKLDLRRAG